MKDQNTTLTKTDYSISNAKSLLNLADELSNFIKERKLSMNIQGKEYALVEAWTYIGSSLGVLPVTVACEDLSTDKEIKYKSTVELINVNTGQKVGQAFAICSNKESRRRNADEYVIASMSMTRAVGKAYRLPFGWLMKAAGYESCNAEEMDFESKAEEVKSEKQVKPTKAQVSPEVQEQTETKMATVKQKTELLLLLNNKLITSDEKNKMIESMNKLDQDRCAKAIAKIKKTIEERTTEHVDDLESELNLIKDEAIKLNYSDIVEAIDNRLEKAGGDEEDIRNLIDAAREEMEKRKVVDHA